jgi:hypothetical protein
MDYRGAMATTAKILPLNRKSIGLSEASALKRRICFENDYELLSVARNHLPNRLLIPNSIVSQSRRTTARNVRLRATPKQRRCVAAAEE